MEAQSAQPILQRGTLSKGRKYGRYDFERFDNCSSTHASAGHATFDKVEVDCKFLFKKSQWGVIGQHKNPAGIIYLDLSFRQPKGSRLHSATVIVTLDDEDQALETMTNKLTRRDDLDPYCPVQLTDSYGPKAFTGPEKFAQTKKSLKLTPDAQIMGNGFGGLGFDKEDSFTYSRRWNFSGHLLPGKGRHWTYRTLKWDLSENDLEPESSHSNEVHTAFTFEHGGQPFFMKVEIQGRLRQLHGRVRDKFKKFPSGMKKEESSVVTLINFGERMSFTKPLDERAKQLQFEMEMANLNAIPMEVSDPKPVTFQSMTQNSGQAHSPNLASQSTMPAAASNNSPQQQLPTTAAQSSLSQNTGAQHVIENATDPTLANLAQAFVDLHSINRRPPSRRDSLIFVSPGVSRRQTANSTAGDIAARVEQVIEVQEVTEEQAPGIQEPAQAQITQVKELTQEQMIAQLLQMPAFLAFVRLIMSVLGWVKKTPESSPPSSIAGNEQMESTRIPRNDQTGSRSEAFPQRTLFASVREEGEENRLFEYSEGRKQQREPQTQHR